MSELPAPADDPRREERWGLIRDVLVFQAKMVLEAARDVLLPLATVAAGGIGLLLGGERPERYFHEVLRNGARFDVWLNLFGPIGEKGRVRALEAGAGVDRYFDSLEKLLVDQHQRGHVSQSAKQAIDQALDRIEALTRSPRQDD